MRNTSHGFFSLNSATGGQQRSPVNLPGDPGQGARPAEEGPEAVRRKSGAEVRGGASKEGRPQIEGKSVWLGLM